MNSFYLFSIIKRYSEKGQLALIKDLMIDIRLFPTENKTENTIGI